MAAGPAQSPEMSRLHTRHHHHHHHPPTIDRRPDGLAPSSRRESPDGLALPERAFQSPSRDSFASKPSVSDASSRSDQSQQQQYHQHHHHTLSYQAAPHRQPSGSPGDRHSARPSQPNARDVEKLAAADAPRDREHRRSRGPTVLADETTTVTYNGGYDDDDDDYREERRMLESKALSTLIYLAGCASLVSLLILFWTLLALVLVLASQPLRLVRSRPALSSELSTLLSPALRLQLRLIHSAAAGSGSDSFRPGRVLAVHLLSPFVSVGVAFASWIAGFFWFFSAVLGDPAGKDGHNDGKATVLGVRAWWAGWLCRGLR